MELSVVESVALLHCRFNSSSEDRGGAAISTDCVVVQGSVVYSAVLSADGAVLE